MAKASDLLQPEDRALLLQVRDAILDWKPELQHLLDCGLPVEEHVKALEEKEQWTKQMFRGMRIAWNAKN